MKRFLTVNAVICDDDEICYRRSMTWFVCREVEDVLAEAAALSSVAARYFVVSSWLRARFTEAASWLTVRGVPFFAEADNCSSDVDDLIRFTSAECQDVIAWFVGNSATTERMHCSRVHGQLVPWIQLFCPHNTILHHRRNFMSWNFMIFPVFKVYRDLCSV